MTTTDKLKRIKEICTANLELASKRTPGEWLWDGDPSNTTNEFRQSAAPWLVAGDISGPAVVSGDAICMTPNATFIAACAGSAEAGWKATIAAIDALQKIACFHEGETVSGAFDEPASAAEAREAILSIISAWEDQL